MLALVPDFVRDEILKSLGQEGQNLIAKQNLFQFGDVTR